MVQLKREKINYPINDKVELNHYISLENSPLKYIEEIIFTIEKGGKFAWRNKEKELVIVALTGRYSISCGENQFTNIGRRNSVFDEIPTDSVYVSVGETVIITCQESGRLLLCFSPTKEYHPTTLIPA